MSKIVIGLTGPTGAGKSTVASAFEKAGGEIIDADKIARDIVYCCVDELKAEYGEDIVDEKGNLDRRLVAKRAFSSPKKTVRLNEITHPKIMQEVMRRIDILQQSGAKAIILDAPLLFESGADRLCTTTVAVTAPLEVRLERIMKRDSISAELAKARISAQHDNTYFTERAEYDIDGAAKMESVLTESERLFRRIMGDYHENN